jgi:hypothetical protein
MELPNNYLPIDEEGYLLQGDLRINDNDIGFSVLSQLNWLPNGSIGSIYGTTPVIIESFDSPLVAQMISRTKNEFIIHFPYEYTQPLNLKTLTVDEWDRFHGRTDAKIPFVMSRKAQAEFFNLVDDYDDDSVTVDGQQIEIDPYYQDADFVENEEWWTQRYKSLETGWDMNEPNPILVDMLPRLKLPPSRILVLGAGRGHDAAHLANAGHFVTAVDISAQAISEGKALYGESANLKWHQSDLFHLPADWTGRFDMIWEHTCFCAINPYRREEVVQVWRRLLNIHGQLMGAFFAFEKQSGPPFGSSEWELRQLLKRDFQFLYWARWKKSGQNRQGKELYILAKKNNR